MSTATMKPYVHPVAHVNKCAPCEGMGRVVEQRSVSKNLYACGYIDVAVKCSACGGTGRAPLPPDSKLASAGD
jgi:DnaJ-class molecular chaperone